MYAVRPKAPTATTSRNAVANRVRTAERWARRWMSHEAATPRTYPARTSRTATSWGGTSDVDMCWLRNHNVRPAKPINRRARTRRGGRGVGCPGGTAGLDGAGCVPEEKAITTPTAFRTTAGTSFPWRRRYPDGAVT